MLTVMVHLVMLTTIETETEIGIDTGTGISTLKERCALGTGII